jgi:hypothetical protein
VEYGKFESSTSSSNVFLWSLVNLEFEYDGCKPFDSILKRFKDNTLVCACMYKLLPCVLLESVVSFFVIAS